jgi:hypothetical protein
MFRLAVLSFSVLLLAAPPGFAADPIADPGFVRFVALGDTGKGNDTQYAVAKAMTKVCAERGGCNFGLLLGDIIYQSGVTSVDDPQWKDKFELPYAGVPFSFYGVLGNHDYGSSWEYWKPPFMLSYAAQSQKLHMPGRHYSFRAGPVEFLAVDTNALFWGLAKEESEAMDLGVQQAKGRPWRIGFGHHPYLSNGKHANAGHYEGLPWSWLPAAGGTLKTFFEEHVCGKVDLYLAGHDHTLQDLGERCGTDWLISGGGSSATHTLTDRNPSEFQKDVPGFLLVEATEDRLDLTFFDEFGKQLHTRSVRAASKHH